MALNKSKLTNMVMDSIAGRALDKFNAEQGVRLSNIEYKDTINKIRKQMAPLDKLIAEGQIGKAASHAGAITFGLDLKDKVDKLDKEHIGYYRSFQLALKASRNTGVQNDKLKLLANREDRRVLAGKLSADIVKDAIEYDRLSALYLD